MFLENRNILFFSAQAFGYQNEIRAEMERMGARVDYFDERPANSFAVKAAIRINRNLLARYIDRYHARIIGAPRTGSTIMSFSSRASPFPLRISIKSRNCIPRRS